MKENGVSKIVNMVSTDLNTIEFLFIYMFMLLCFPFCLIINVVVLWIRFDGPIGLVLLIIMVLVYPF